MPNGRIHSASAPAKFWRADMVYEPCDFSLSHQEEGVEYNRLSESNGQNRLDQNLGGGTGVTSHGIRGRPADQTNRQGRAKRRQTNVYVPNHIHCSFLFPAAT